jgi:dynein light chain 1
MQAGIEKCSRLRVLYASNNRIKDWGEVDRLSALAELEELLLVGNPLYNEWKENGALPQYRIEVRLGRAMQAVPLPDPTRPDNQLSPHACCGNPSPPEGAQTCANLEEAGWCASGC